MSGLLYMGDYCFELGRDELGVGGGFRAVYQASNC